jgi:hypothetical protein
MLTGMMWLVTRRRPLVFFGLPGAFLLTAGLVVGLWVVYIFSTVHIVPIGYALISVSLCVGGALILCTGAILYSVQELVTTLAQTRQEAAQKPQTSRGFRQLIERYWPLLFFALPGALLLLGGTGVGAWRVVLFVQARVLLSIGYALLIMLLITAGSLWFIGGIILYSIQTLVRDVIKSKV